MRLLLTSVLLLFSFCCFAQSITSAEYFFNSDPGVGNGTALNVNSNSGQLTQTLSVPTTGLTDGFNSLYIRTYNSDTKWSLYDRQSFYLKNLTSTNIISAEYFFNTDPGVGNGTILTVTSNTGNLSETFSIPINSLSPGFSSLFIRTQNNNNIWSLYDRQSFYIGNFNTHTIKAAEYFFNTDPGVGNGTALSIDTNSGQLSQVFSIPTTSLPDGFHSFYLRTQDHADYWSLYDRALFYIKDFDFSPDEVTNAEYFIDEDPGIGNGTPIVFTDASETSQILNVSTEGIENGEHLFYVRVQDSNGDWSIYDVEEFTIDSSLGLDKNLFKTTKIYPNPFENELNIKLNDNLEISKIKVYNKIGQTVYSSSENLKTLKLSSLKSGIYILNLEINSSHASFKIIKR